MKTSKQFKTGFTLIELLVVIAIISLLVSILLPSLNTAKELARRAVCASNIRSCGTGINIYSGEWNGCFPLHANGIHDKGTVGTEGKAPMLPWRTYAAYWVYWADSFNLAGLYEEDYIDNPGIFYCPSTTNPAHQYETYKDIWALPTNAERRRETVKVSYCFNPYNDGSNERPYTSFTDMPMNKPLLMDIPLSRSLTAHNTTTVPGWNVMTPDSSVQFIQSQDVWDILLNDALNTWGSFDGYTYCHGIMNTFSEE